MSPPRLCKCGREISKGRWSTGARTCLDCGDQFAQEEINNKRKRVGPVYNKGGDQYLGSVEQTREILKTAGARKNLPLNQQVHGRVEPRSHSRSMVHRPVLGSSVRGLLHVHATAPLPSAPSKTKAKVIGVYFKGGNRPHVLRQGEDPPKGTTRIVIFSDTNQNKPNEEE